MIAGAARRYRATNRVTLLPVGVEGGWLFFATGLSLAAGVFVAKRPTDALILCTSAALIVLALTRTRYVVLIALPSALLVPPNVLIHLRGLPHLTALRAAVLICTLTSLASAAFRRDKPAPIPRILLLAELTFAVYVWSLALAEGGHGAIRQALVFTVGAAAPLLLVWWALRNDRDVERFVSILVAVGCVASSLALYEVAAHRHLLAADGSFIFHAGDRYGLIRAQSVFPHPILFGVALVLLLPVAFARAAEGHRWCWLAFALMAAALVATISRGAWVAAIIAVAVTAARLRGRSLRYLAILGAACITAFLFIPTVRQGIDGLLKPTSGEDAYVIAYREQLLVATQNRVESHPFAATLDPQKLPEIQRSVNGQTVDLSLSVDNTYARYALQLGGVGLAVFLVLLGMVVWLTSRGKKGLSSAVLGGQVGLLVAALTVDTLTFEQIGVLFWSLAGLGLWLARNEIVVPSQRSSRLGTLPALRVRQELLRS